MITQKRETLQCQNDIFCVETPFLALGRHIDISYVEPPLLALGHRSGALRLSICDIGYF